MPVPKPSQPVPRSPLHNAFASPLAPDQSAYPSLPPNQSHAHSQPPMQNYPPAPGQSYSPLVEGISAIRVEGPSPETEVPRDIRDSREMPAKEKEKKKFWGMGMGMGMNMNWGERKDKDKSRKEADRPSADDGRRSAEWQRAEERTASSHGHVSTDEEGHRGRSLGLSVGSIIKDNPATLQVDNVTAAIRESASAVALWPY